MRCENQEFSAPTEGEIGNLGQHQSERDRKTWGGGGIFKMTRWISWSKIEHFFFACFQSDILLLLISIQKMKENWEIWKIILLLQFLSIFLTVS